MFCFLICEHMTGFIYFRLNQLRTKIYKTNGQILLTAKAYNGRCIAEWLQSCFEDAMRRDWPDDQDQIPLLWSGLKLRAN